MTVSAVFREARLILFACSGFSLATNHRILRGALGFNHSQRLFVLEADPCVVGNWKSSHHLQMMMMMCKLLLMILMSNLLLVMILMSNLLLLMLMMLLLLVVVM
jgi:hypothetical protein